MRFHLSPPNNGAMGPLPSLSAHGSFRSPDEAPSLVLFIRRETRPWPLRPRLLDPEPLAPDPWGPAPGQRERCSRWTMTKRSLGRGWSTGIGGGGEGTQTTGSEKSEDGFDFEGRDVYKERTSKWQKTKSTRRRNKGEIIGWGGWCCIGQLHGPLCVSHAFSLFSLSMYVCLPACMCVSRSDYMPP